MNYTSEQISIKEVFYRMSNVDPRTEKSFHSVVEKNMDLCTTNRFTYSTSRFTFEIFYFLVKTLQVVQSVKIQPQQ